MLLPPDTRPKAEDVLNNPDFIALQNMLEE